MMEDEHSILTEEGRGHDPMDRERRRGEEQTEGKQLGGDAGDERRTERPEKK